MNKKLFYEELYSSCHGIIVPKRRSLLMPVLLLIVSAILFYVQSLPLGINGENSTLSSLCLVISVALGIISLLSFVSRLSGDGSAYHVPSGKFLKENILSFGNSTLSEVQNVLNDRDLDLLKKMNIKAISPLSCMLVSTEDETFAACMLFIYSNLEYKKASGLVILKQ